MKLGSARADIDVVVAGNHFLRIAPVRSAQRTSYSIDSFLVGHSLAFLIRPGLTS